MTDFKSEYLNTKQFRNSNLIIGICLVFSISCLITTALAAEVYNYALGTQPVGTFISAASAVDNNNATFAQSGNIADSPQFLTIDLGRELYIGSVKIYWNAGALSRDYSVRVSRDKKNWFTEFSELDAGSGAADPSSNTVVQIISARRYTIPSRYVQIYIPMGSSASSSQVGIAEVQVLPAENLQFSLLEVTPYAVGNNKAIIVYKTSIGAVSGQVLYGRDPNRLDMVANNLESGVVNSATLSKLDPNFVYFFRVRAWDAFGREISSGIKSFRPPPANLALYRSASGTFSNLPPNDRLVDTSKDVLSRTTDGVTGYFKGMATSGSLRSKDQQVTIDLGAVYPLNSVVTYWRALAYPENFSVRVSDDLTSWKEVGIKINAGEGAFARSDAGDPMRVVNTPLTGQKARYVQVYVEKDAPYFVKHANWDFVQLMEVEVYPK